MTLGKQHIDDERHLYRWIHPNHLKSNGITSAAFKHGDKEKTRNVSVDVAEWTTPQECLSFANHPQTRLGVLIAGEVRRVNHQCVSHDPLDNRYAHALIIGDKTRRVCKILAKICCLLD